MSDLGWQIRFFKIEWNSDKCWEWYIFPSLLFHEWDKSVIASYPGCEYWSCSLMLLWLKFEVGIGLVNICKAKEACK